MEQKRILIVDDEDDIREVAELSLASVGGFDVSTAESGRQGIEKAREEQPDAILLDVMMPDMDGPSTFAELQGLEETSDIPVLFVTAKVQPADRRRFAELGVAGLVAKPFNPMTLSEQVADALDWSD